MAHNNNVNELFFTGQGDPRHKCVAIGYHNNAPVVYRFDTVDLPQGTRTSVRVVRPVPNRGLTDWAYQVTFNEHIEVAFLDWAVGVHLGSVLRDTDRIPMADFVSHGTTNTSVPLRFRQPDTLSDLLWFVTAPDSFGAAQMAMNFLNGADSGTDNLTLMRCGKLGHVRHWVPDTDRFRSLCQSARRQQRGLPPMIRRRGRCPRWDVPMHT